LQTLEDSKEVIRSGRAAKIRKHNVEKLTHNNATQKTSRITQVYLYRDRRDRIVVTFINICRTSAYHC